ncbi:MAG: radical SAM protein [Phycisphaerales bacterium]|nr:MAG: radical SAM protein [Phycisphaerales bacterium]
MKVIAAIEVDLHRTPLGTAPRFAEQIGGQTVLARTVTRVARAKRLDGVFVLCPDDQESQCRSLLSGRPATLRSHSAGPPPYRPLVRVVRKWALDSWRGGMGGSAVIDEYTHTAVLASLAAAEKADAVAVVPGPCPLIDPGLIDTLVEHFGSVSDDTLMTFMQTPPGLSPVIFQSGLLAELARQGIPPGWTMSYKPDRPETDLASRKCACNAPQALRHACGRFIADTDRATETIRAYLADHPEPPSSNGAAAAEHVGQWAINRQSRYVPPLPRELEIELTTQDSLASKAGVELRPVVPPDRQRGPINPDLVRRLARELAVMDDTLVVLGGFGDPLLHPRFTDILAYLRQAGIYGIAVRTGGARLADASIAALVEHEVDVVTVLLDAWTPQRYRELHGGDLEPVIEAMDRLARARQEHDQPAPLVVPEMVKAVPTVDEMEAFFDGWLRKHGWATIVGYSRYGGALPDRCVIDMSPPLRCPCRRINTRCTVLADGGVIACDQDFAAARPVGSLLDSSLGEVWTGPKMTDLRAHHAAGRYDADPLCAACSEWHRP